MKKEQTWSEYLKYLMGWAEAHKESNFYGCSPIGFDEFKCNEMEE